MGNEIIIDCLCSTVPGLTWRSKILIKKKSNKVEIWGSPDIDEYELELIDTIKGRFRNKKFLKYCSSSETMKIPDGCIQYVDVTGFDKFWYPYLLISMSEGYSKLTGEFLSFDKDSLIQFTNINGDFVNKNNNLNTKLLDKIKKYVERIEDITYGESNLKQILDLHSKNKSLELSFIKTVIDKLEKKVRKEEQEVNRRQKIYKRKILKNFKKEINFYLSNYKKYSQGLEGFYDFTEYMVENYIKDQTVINLRLPNQIVYVHRKRVWIRRYGYQLSIKKNIKKSKNIRVGSPDWGNIGSVDFKKLYKDYISSES
jgi:predicted DNA binding CopG/RHH family protein